MFLLSNIHGRNHREIYQHLDGEGTPIFDISQKQLGLPVNADWCQLKAGDLVCVVSSSHKMSTVYLVGSVEAADHNEEQGDIFVVKGEVVAKFPQERAYTQTLDRYGVVHARLKNNKFSVGFNVANLGDQLDEAEVRTAGRLVKQIGALKQELNA